METSKIWGWILIVLGVLDALRVLLGKVAAPVINWIAIAVLIIVGIYLLMKK